MQDEDKRTTMLAKAKDQALKDTEKYAQTQRFALFS